LPTVLNEVIAGRAVVAEKLRSGVLAAFWSGSGSCVCCIEA
jgi:hypothetical protein